MRAPHRLSALRSIARLGIPLVSSFCLIGCIVYPRIPPFTYETPQYQGYVVDERGQPLAHVVVRWKEYPALADTTGPDGIAVLRAVRRFSPVGMLAMDEAIGDAVLLVQSEDGVYPLRFSIERHLGGYDDQAGQVFRPGYIFRTSITDTIKMSISDP